MLRVDGTFGSRSRTSPSNPQLRRRVSVRPLPPRYPLSRHGTRLRAGRFPRRRVQSSSRCRQRAGECLRPGCPGRHRDVRWCAPAGRDPWSLPSCRGTPYCRGGAAAAHAEQQVTHQPGTGAFARCLCSEPAFIGHRREDNGGALVGICDTVDGQCELAPVVRDTGDSEAHQAGQNRQLRQCHAEAFEV